METALKFCRTCKYEPVSGNDLPCRECYCELLGVPVELTRWEEKEKTDDFDGRLIQQWKDFSRQQKNVPPEFVKIVEENFWELLV